jgi:hypothetical protein
MGGNSHNAPARSIAHFLGIASWCGVKQETHAGMWEINAISIYTEAESP